MELTVSERLLLLDILPTTGNLTTIRLVHDLRQALSFSDDEVLALSFKQDNSRIEWDPGVEAKMKPKVFNFGQPTAEIAKRALLLLSEAEGLRLEHLSLCEKFGVG